MEEDALSFFAKDPNANISLLAQELGCSQRTAERLVAKLKLEGKLCRKGSARAGKWIVLRS